MNEDMNTAVKYINILHAVGREEEAEPHLCSVAAQQCKSGEVIGSAK